MIPDLEKLDALLIELGQFNAKLVAVSKTKSVDAIETVYKHGHRVFGENYVQELVAKQPFLPGDVNWHFIGHLQANKVKHIAPFVNLIHGIDSRQLVAEVSKQAIKLNRTVDVLLQVHIASEETKFGLLPEESKAIMTDFCMHPAPGVNIRGLMGMASFTDDEGLIRKEFHSLRMLFESISQNCESVTKDKFNVLSMGMSGDYKIALGEGSNMVRIGSAIFGER